LHTSVFSYISSASYSWRYAVHKLTFYLLTGVDVKIIFHVSSCCACNRSEDG